MIKTKTEKRFDTQAGVYSEKNYEPSTERTYTLRERWRHAPCSISSERARLVTESYRETKGEHPAIRQAKALAHVLRHIHIFINPDELIVGGLGATQNIAQVFPEYDVKWLKEELDTISERGADPFILKKQDKKELKKVIRFWEENETTFRDRVDSRLSDEDKKAVQIGAISGCYHNQGGPGHFIPGLGTVVEKGLNSIIAEAQKRLDMLDVTEPEDMEKYYFLNAVIISDKAVIEYSNRFAQKASELAEKENNYERKKELLEIAEICERVPGEPARNLKEVLQSVVFSMFTLQLEGNHFAANIGRIDQFAFPYYKKDKEDGNLTEVEVKELLECTFIKLAEYTRIFDEETSKFFSGYPTFMQITLGGQTRQGLDATNELSYLLLDITANLQIEKPTVSIRFHNGTPRKFIEKAAEVMFVHRGGMPQVHNDDVAVPARLAAVEGLTKEDAYDWAIVGCVELGNAGKGLTDASWTTFLNLPKVLEMAIHEGKDHLTGLELGPRTDGIINWNTFEDMLRSFYEHLDFYHKLFVKKMNLIHKLQGDFRPLPLLSSLMTEYCIERGKSVTAGGGRYGGSYIDYIGIATLGNSLASIRKLIFEDRELTASNLKHALETNFEDDSTNPPGRAIQKVCFSTPKYGNDTDYVDLMLRDVLNGIVDRVRQYKDPEGYRYTANITPVTSNVAFGLKTGATPDGRKKEKPISEGCSPVQHTETRGPTAVLKSVSKLDHVNFSGGTQLNMKVSPKSVSDKRGLEIFVDLVRTYMQLGGYHVQFNVISSDMLIDAQRHPEEYSNLLVRVAGYSARFIDLCKEVQDDIIVRTEHVL